MVNGAIVEVGVRPHGDGDEEDHAGQHVKDVVRDPLQGLRGSIVEKAALDVLCKGRQGLGHLTVVPLVVLPQLCALCWGRNGRGVGRVRRRTTKITRLAERNRQRLLPGG